MLLVQGHTAGKWQSQDLSFSCLSDVTHPTLQHIPAAGSRNAPLENHLG
jgi:hypothetical protein